jgi:Fe-S-cluster-containing dehydrogenase component
MKRRDILKLSAFAVAGVAGAELVKAFSLDKYDANRHYYVFVVDARRCIGCGRCVKACKVENDVPDGYYRTWVERYTWLENGELKIESPEGGFNGFPPLKDENVIKSYFVPKLCNQCENPPCVQVCPVGATFKTPDGVVLVDPKYCIGCRYCIQACPYGARYIYPEEGKDTARWNTADKCTFCYHRLKRGLKPACVEVCPTKARMIFDLGNPDEKAKFLEIINNDRVAVLKPEMNTKPKVFYIGIDSEVR